MSVPHSAVEIFNTPSDAISRSKCGWALDFFFDFFIRKSDWSAGPIFASRFKLLKL